MLLTHLQLAVLWILFGVFHSVFASNRFKTAVFAGLPGFRPYYRAAYVLFAFSTLGGVLAYQLAIPSPLLLEANWRPAGYTLMAPGGLLMAICIRKYFLSLSGLRSLVRQQVVKGPLRVDGVHRYVRHPLYLGTFMLVWGVFLAIPTLSLLVMAIAIHAYTLLGIRYEEAKLIREFGFAYLEYCARVPRLLPFPLPKKSQIR